MTDADYLAHDFASAGAAAMQWTTEMLANISFWRECAASAEAERHAADVRRVQRSRMRKVCG